MINESSKAWTECYTMWYNKVESIFVWKLRFFFWGSLDAVLYSLKLIILFLIHSERISKWKIKSLREDVVFFGYHLLIPGFPPFKSYFTSQYNNNKILKVANVLYVSSVLKVNVVWVRHSLQRNLKNTIWAFHSCN